MLELLAVGSHDKDTLMAARTAGFLFPAGLHRSQDEAYTAYIARVKLMYHKQVLDVPEVTCTYIHACKNVAAALSISCTAACSLSQGLCACLSSRCTSFVWIWHVRAYPAADLKCG